MQNIRDLRKTLDSIKKCEDERKKDNFSLVKKIQNEDWQPIANKSMRKLDREHVYVRYTHTNKKRLITVYIGKEVADLLGYKKNDRVGILSTLSSPNLFLVVKNPEAISSYAISTTSKSENCHFNFSLNREINFPKSQSLPVNFDLSQNYELIIDVGQIIKM